MDYFIDNFPFTFTNKNHYENNFTSVFFLQ